MIHSGIHNVSRNDVKMSRTNLTDSFSHHFACGPPGCRAASMALGLLWMPAWQASGRYEENTVKKTDT